MLTGTEEADGKMVEEEEGEEEAVGQLVVLGHTFAEQSNRERLNRVGRRERSA